MLSGSAKTIRLKQIWFFRGHKWCFNRLTGLRSILYLLSIDRFGLFICKRYWLGYPLIRWWIDFFLLEERLGFLLDFGRCCLGLLKVALGRL